MKTFAIIPALNESATLNKVVRRVIHYVDQVVVVDDGSNQPLQVDFLPDSSVKVIRHQINLGKGAAMTTGTQYAQRHGAEAVVFIDADGQHQPEEIPALLKPLRDNTADVVFGVRMFQQSMPLVAKIGNIFLTRMISLLFGINVRDTQSGFRAFRMSVYPKLCWHSARYSVETEMIVNTGKHHLRWTEIPIKTIYLDKYRGTTVVDGIRIFINMIAWRFR